MKVVLLAGVAALIAGCVPPGATFSMVGLELGPRYHWVKDGVSERDTRIQLLDCAMAVPNNATGTPDWARHSQVDAERRACMTNAGYRIVSR